MTRAAIALLAIAGLVAFPQTSVAQGAGTAAFDATFCAEVHEYMDWTNATLDAGRANADPVMLDERTRFDDVAVDCTQRAVRFRHFVDAPDSPELRAFNTDRWNATWCVPGVWREAIGLGWTVTDTITFADGGRHDLVAACR